MTTSIATTATAADAITFILSSASDADLKRIYAAAGQRRKTLNQVASAGIGVGDDVVLTGLTPRALNGLAGTVRAERKARMDVLLTDESTRMLASAGVKLSRSALHSASIGERHLLTGVPSVCLRPGN